MRPAGCVCALRAKATVSECVHRERGEKKSVCHRVVCVKLLRCVLCFSAPFYITQPHAVLLGTHQQLWVSEAHFCILILEALCEMES